MLKVAKDAESGWEKQKKQNEMFFDLIQLDFT